MVLFEGVKVLDIRFIRENTDIVDAVMQSRNYDWDRQAFLALDSDRRQLIGQVEAWQEKRNVASKRIGELMRIAADDPTAGPQAEDLKDQVRVINEQITELESKLGSIGQELDALVMTLPNLLADSVPEGIDESENVEVRRWGSPPEFDFEPKTHWDIGTGLSIIDFERAVKLARSRFVLLSGAGARLERALISFMLDTHLERGYHEWWPP
ncbi:MAG: serine--tRNA ligase, partial [Coriobacteriales bacterium]|nr:serine--tRNA ligase [Coriobacteriales bacterium]